MKKKLLTILLSIAVILTSTVTVFAVGSSETIEAVKTHRGAGSVNGNHFDIVFDDSDGDGWIVSSGNGITISSKNNEKITRVELIVGDGGSGDAMDYLSTSCPDGWFWTEKTPVVKTYVITLYLPEEDYLTSVDIDWANTSGSVYFNAAKITYTDPVTVDSLLATVKGGFPESIAGGWVNANGITMHKENANSKLYFDGQSEYISLSTGVIPSGNDYTYTEHTSTYDHTFVFHMTDDKLTSISVSGYTDDHIERNGKYKLFTLEEAYLTIDDFDETQIDNVTCQENDYYIDEYVYLFFKDKQFAYGYDGIWFDSSEIQIDTPDNISDCDTIVECFYLNASKGVLSKELKIYVNGNDLPIESGEESKIEVLREAIVSRSEIEIDSSYNVHEAIKTNEVAWVYCQNVILPKDYEINQGNEITINIDEDKDVIFKSNAPFSKFKEVQVDGAVIIKDTDYAVIEGSTKVTLKSSYLKKLVNGEHTLNIVSTDGNASTTFTITRNVKPSPNPGYVVPNTGVEGTYSNNHSLLKLSSLSLLVIGTCLVIKKKKDND